MKYSHAYIKYGALLTMICAALLARSTFANAVTTDCSTNLSTNAATYTLAADTPNNCNITGTGITLDGAGHQFGTNSAAPQAFPNNASSGGWIDMTNNTALYHLNETSGTVLDYSGHGGSATPTGSIIYSNQGRVEGAVGFGGAHGNYFSNTSNFLPSLDGATFSVSIWFKRGQVSVNHAEVLVDKNGAHNTRNDFEVIIRGTDWGVVNRPTCAFYNDDLESSVAVTDFNWHHVVCTYNSATNARKIYLDGSLTGSNTSGGPLSSTNSGHLNIGDAPHFGNVAFKGSIDEVAFWSSELSGSDVTNIYTTQVSGAQFSQLPNGASNSSWVDMTGNVMLMHMDDTSTSVADASGNSNNGVQNGSPTYSSTGKVGNSVSLNGSAYFTIPGSSSMNMQGNTTAISIGMWAKPDHSPSNEALMVQRDPINFQIYADWQGSGPFFMFSGQQCNMGQALQANTWSYLMFTYDGTNIREYLNGALINTCSQPGAMNFGSNRTTAIGTDFYGHGFIGSMDEVSMWSRTLSPSEIATIYTQQTGGSASGGNITANGNSFSLTNATVLGTITSAGATISIANSTVATVNVTGANATGNGQDGGTINLTNTTAGALIANGGNSTDNGQGGAAGSFNLTSSSATSQTANPGNCGPNAVGCEVIFTDNGSGDWDDTANWSNGMVPDSSTNVVINSSVTNISSGSAYANNVTFADGTVWDPYYNYLYLYSSGTTTFNGSSYFNYGELTAISTVFNDSSFIGSGYIHGNAEFHGTSYTNAWQIDNDATFYDSSYFYCSYAGGNVVLNDSSYIGDCGGSGSGTLTINSNWYSGTAPTNGVLIINGNYGGYWGGNFSNTIYGSDNQPIDTFQFENGAYNNASIYVTNSVFNASFNNSFISQNATFNSDSANTNEVDGVATFNGTSINYNGSLYGQAIFNEDSSEFYPGYSSSNPVRYYSSPIATSRDFTSDGYSWVITADAVVVDLSGATCNANTTFLPVNGGSFIYGPNCLSGPPGVSIISPANNAVITSSWAPQVNWNQGAGGYNYTSCQYSFGNSSDWNGVDDWASGPSVGSWSGASCTGNGSDILVPTNRGTQLFVIRAFYNGTATTSIRTINYTPSRQLYFYNPGPDANWSTVGNWYTDVSHTVSAGSLPTQVDKVNVLFYSIPPTVNIDTWTQPNLINSGNTGIVFNSSTNASTTVTINGKAQYTGSAKNKGIVNGVATFNDASANIGTVKSFAIFNASSTNSATVQGGATFNGDSTGNTGTVLGIKTRYYNATTTATRNFTGWTVVADGVTVDVSSSTHDSSTIFRTVNGGSFIGGPATVYWYSNGADTNWTTISNWFSVGSTTPLGRVASSTEMVVILGTSTPTIDLLTWTQPSGIDASLTGLIISASTTSHISTGITGNTILSGAIINDGVISGNTSLFNTSKNSSTGTIVGSADFYGTTQNNGLVSGDATFHNSSLNSAGGSITGDVTFSDSSYNNTTAGSIGGTATFNDSSYNIGTISYNAIFYNNATENNGTVDGLKTRYFTSTTTVNRNFVTTGPWILVADAVEVTVASTSVFNATTTFTESNGGNFVGEGIPGSYTTCAKDLMFAGTYTLATSTANICNIKSNGVVLDGASNQFGVGSLPQAFPNNASSGWIDMTGNKLLYHMNESSGSIIDSSGQNHTGSVTGAPTYSVSGVVDSAVTFVSNSSYIQATTPLPSLNYNSSFTVSSWIKLPNPNFQSVLYFMGQKGASNTFFSVIYMDSSGHVVFRGCNENVNCTDIPSSVSISANTWHNVVGVYNNQVMTIYIDGISSGTTNYSMGPTNIAFSPTLYIGRYPTWNGFTGSVDEFAIWNRVLSPSEISSIYSQQLGGFTGGNITANGNSFSLTNATVLGSITSVGATISIANSTVAAVNVNGADAVGDAQAGGTINLTNSTGGALTANGGNSTDFGFGGAAGHINLTSSTAVSQTANAGSNGPNKGTGQQNTGGSSGNSSSIPGCTDSSASNYSSSATVDNGSCRYSVQIVRGCTDPGARNYNPNATVNNGSCSYASYNPYVAPAGGNSGGGGNNSTPTFNGVTIQVGSVGGSLILKPLPAFAFGVNGSGDTILGNPLAGLQAPGALQLKALKFSFTLPLSDFLFAPLPKSITDALSKAPKLSDTIASVGISRAQDLVKLQKQAILLPRGGGDTPGLFVVTNGTTTLDTFVSKDLTHDLIELVNVHTGDVLNVSLIPLSKGKVTGVFAGSAFTFIPTPKTAVYTVITAPSVPGRYLLTTASAPLPLVINVTAPPPPPAPEKQLHWWQKVVKWIRGS
ncbi:MAG: hypothetical protein PHG25_02185 [Candidatus Pacebacteria bacterium]|nr:hypothetical protein [Candidatus Paceibacterota bacterium]